MSELSERFRDAIPSWGKKEKAESLQAIQSQIESVTSSLQSLNAHLAGQPLSYREFWNDVLSKRRQDVEELEGIKRLLLGAIGER
jgi:hypothetical protein